MANEKSKEKIKHLSVWEECNKNSKEFRKKHEPLNKKYDRLCQESRRIEEEKKDLFNKINELQTKQVFNTLYFIHTYLDVLGPNCIRFYLMNCLWMLNGLTVNFYPTFRDPNLPDDENLKAYERYHY